MQNLLNQKEGTITVCVCHCTAPQSLWRMVTHPPGNILTGEGYTWCPTWAGRTGSWQHLRWGSAIDLHHCSINICILIHLLRVAAPMAAGELSVLHPLLLWDPSPCFILDQQLCLCQGAAAHAPWGPTLALPFTPVTAGVTGEELVLRRASVALALVLLVAGVQIPRLCNHWFLQFFVELIHQASQELLGVLQTKIPCQYPARNGAMRREKRRWLHSQPSPRAPTKVSLLCSTQTQLKQGRAPKGLSVTQML